MPWISIIVPIYNAGPFLSDCLESISAQTFKDFECILVDDGSSDGSSSICDAYASCDSRFKVIHQINQGNCAARNTGIQAAQGKYLIFVDSDDTISLDLLQFLYSHRFTLDASTFLIWNFTETQSVLHTGPVTSSATTFLSSAQPLPSNFTLLFPPWNKLFLTTFLLENQIFFDETHLWAEDAFFCLHYLHTLKEKYGSIQFLYSDAPLYFHRPSNVNITSSRRTQRFPFEVALYQNLHTFFIADLHFTESQLASLHRHYFDSFLHIFWYIYTGRMDLSSFARLRLIRNYLKLPEIKGALADWQACGCDTIALKLMRYKSPGCLLFYFRRYHIPAYTWLRSKFHWGAFYLKQFFQKFLCKRSLPHGRSK